MEMPEITLGLPDDIEEQKIAVQRWFQKLQQIICSEFERLEDELTSSRSSFLVGRFQTKDWLRDKNQTEDLGGGRMSILRGGRVFEKAAVHVSTVYGELSSDFRDQVPGTSQSPYFWATGLSGIVHPYNPHVPVVHINTRMMITGSYWFGGGMDLTPLLESRRKSDDTDVLFFHNSLKKLCGQHKIVDYEHYKAWCDEYFFLPHRQESRGMGGIFFDRLHSPEEKGGFNADFSFVRALGECFVDIYPLLVRRNYDLPFVEQNREEQLMRRGRYVEFNLLYDRGTNFGLKTGGNVESILSSMPPMVSWT
ncbi:oxygen-dependent coproporphyrinogen oxidase [Candidatus Liberibacter sp.]|uniref:oxygen-dependent coproporphyrinogen oxidase n=1 Tax=Candidatus Liberibacter sp. TaxID=34022 RepID=UPI0015F3A841|nr:oxygen-dependent coproporphyrinogen oxidase [Candidatus Liberibacter sp.]MBA5724039.1 oxygen-dependent coproporphyrinogen oxidase [Candidatus Liberibacter sp.]